MYVKSQGVKVLELGLMILDEKNDEMQVEEKVHPGAEYHGEGVLGGLA